MQLGQISICDNIGYNIKSDEDKSRILKELEENFNIRVIRRHHERFNEDAHVPVINNIPHLTSVRTNGNPYFLYLTRLNFVNQCILIDKKVQQGYFYPRMILIRLWFDDDLYNNTLFEGEMVKQFDETWTFLINDILVLQNESNINVNLVQRINKLHHILESKFVPDDTDLCRIRVKRFFRCNDLKRMLIDFIPRLPYSCRGIYFNPLYAKHSIKLLNFDDSLIKKVVRTNFKNNGDFFLLSDKDRLVTQVATQSQQSSVNINDQETIELSPKASKCDPSAPVVDAIPMKNDTHTDVTQTDTHRTMWVRHTRLPDVYELYRQPGDVGKGPSEALIACVTTMEQSRALRHAFMFSGVTEVIPMRCVFNPRFKKWMPFPSSLPVQHVS